MLRRTLLFVALLAPLTALGQTIRLESPGPFTSAECSGTTSVVLYWGVPAGTVLQDSWTYRIVASTTNSCDTSSAAKVVASDIQPDKTNSGDATGLTNQRYPTAGGVGTLTVATFATTTGVDCSANFSKMYTCVQLMNGTTWVASSTITSLTIEGAPATPINLSVSPGEGALNVIWDDGPSNGVTPSSYEVTAAPATGCPVPPSTAPPCTLGSVVSTGTTGAGTRSIRLGGLTIGTLYGVRVYALSGSRQKSAASEIATGTPIDVFDFWEKYTSMGGQEEGGCAAGSAGALSLLAVAGLLRAFRRRP